MTQQQWQEVEAIVRKEQLQALQHMNTKRHDTEEILDELYELAHNPTIPLVLSLVACFYLVLVLLLLSSMVTCIYSQH